jgi:DNA topoisomerase-1
VCGKNLVIRHSRAGKQFVGCLGYPTCKNTYPLPQRKKITATDKNCEVCGAPIVKISGRKGQEFEMCLNIKCKTKENYLKEKK